MSGCVASGDLAFKQYDFEKALEEYSNIFDEADSATRSELHLKKALCLVELKRFAEALTEAEACTYSSPACVAAFILQGQCLSEMVKFEDAYRAYRKGLDIDPDSKAVASGLRDLQKVIVAQYEAAERMPESSYDALKLCTQDPYPGDDELEAAEKTIMQHWNLQNAPSVVPQLPEPEVARKRFAQGVRARANGNLAAALDHFTAALEHDMTNFENWKGRVHILYEMENYKEAYRTINAFPVAVRSAGIWLRGGKILKQLQLPIKAEKWLRRATQLNKDAEDKEAAVLFQKIRVRRIYGPLADGTDAEVTFTQYGRAVCATKDLENHNIVMTDTPLILSQTLVRQHLPACANCATSMIKPKHVFDSADLKRKDLKNAVGQIWPERKIYACSKCDKELYCSPRCRDTAWECYHRVVCASTNKRILKLYEVCENFNVLNDDGGRSWKGWWNASFSPFILVRMWATMACEAQRLAKTEGRSLPNSCDWKMAQAPLRRFIAYGSSSNADVIPNMYELMIDIFKDLGDGLKFDITKREFDGRYFQATCNVQAFSDSRNPLRIFVERLQAKHQWSGIYKYIPEDPPEAEFAGMFQLHACLNHSCANNAEVMDYVVDGKPGVGVRVRGRMAKGDEVFITYINTAMPRRQRRAWLFRSYNFWCRCQRCNFEGDGPGACTHCGVEASEENKLPQCSKCKKAWYCSQDCQKLAWKKGHKKICKMEHSNTSSISDQYITNL